MSHTPQSRLVDQLRSLAVDEAPVPADLAARAVAAARAVGSSSSPSFLEELVFMARRGVVLGAACASLLAVLAIGTTAIAATPGAAVTAVDENPLVSWWDGTLSEATSLSMSPMSSVVQP